MKNILSPKEQDSTFCFYPVTNDGMKYFHFQWPSISMMHMRVLNTICGWENMIDWIDDEYAWPTAKMVRMTLEIRSEARKLKLEICQKDQIQENKSEMSDFCKLLEAVNDDELFFIYRVVYSFPVNAFFGESTLSFIS